MHALTLVRRRPERPPRPDRRSGRCAPRIRRAAAELTPETIEQIAQRVAQLLRSDQACARTGPDRSRTLVDAAELARRLSVNRAWVYAHAAELGAVMIGDGPRPRLRFDPEIAAEALREHARSVSTPQSSAPREPRYRRPRREQPVPLLPIGQRGRCVTPISWRVRGTVA